MTNPHEDNRRLRVINAILLKALITARDHLVYLDREDEGSGYFTKALAKADAAIAAATTHEG